LSADFYVRLFDTNALAIDILIVILFSSSLFHETGANKHFVKEKKLKVFRVRISMVFVS
jgi:hypothetical protein